MKVMCVSGEIPHVLLRSCPETNCHKVKLIDPVTSLMALPTVVWSVTAKVQQSLNIAPHPNLLADLL